MNINLPGDFSSPGRKIKNNIRRYLTMFRDIDDMIFEEVHTIVSER